MLEENVWSFSRGLVQKHYGLPCSPERDGKIESCVDIYTVHQFWEKVQKKCSDVRATPNTNPSLCNMCSYNELRFCRAKFK